jgi:hypothetical protein
MHSRLLLGRRHLLQIFECDDRTSIPSDRWLVIIVETKRGLLQIPKPVIIANTPANRYSLLPRVYGLDVMAHQLRRRDCNPQIAYTGGISVLSPLKI